jgi:cytochrome d ubiquinol oxidase subunit II
LDLLHPYALLGGLTTLLLCATHGAIYLALKTRGEVLERSRRAAAVLAPANAITVAAFATWTLANASNSRHVGVTAVAVGIAAGVAAVAVPVLLRTRSRWAFGLHGAVIALVLAMLFLDLYPSVLVSSTNSAFNLTLASAASGTYTLKVMTVVAAVLIPTVLAGQAWVYRVFRTPVGREDFGETG